MLVSSIRMVGSFFSVAITTPFFALTPREVAPVWLRLLSLRDRVRCSGVCREWRNCVLDTPELWTALDLTVLTLIYLPTFYTFKAAVFTGSSDPAVWLSSGLGSYEANFAKDEFDLLRVWFPADLVCFSVPLYLRLPVRHVVSFVWTAYLSFARGGH